MYYEQKYKEALERARIWQNHLYDTNDRDYADELNYIFPELTESEDERIRKDIIWCLKHSGIKESGPINPHVTTITKDAIAWLEKQGEQKVSYTTIVETGDGGINALVTRELSTNGCGDEQNPADKAEPIVVRDFNSVFSREKVKEIDKRIEKSQKLYNAKLRDAMRKVEDFPMTD